MDAMVKEPEAKASREEEGVSIVDLQHHHCRWPLNKRDVDGLVMYCGKTRVRNSSYCLDHAMRAWRPSQRHR
jgi:hypothetical protein